MLLQDRIRNKRLEKDMTLEEVAALVGVKAQTIFKYETGIVTNIPSNRIEQLADTLGTTPGYLMGWEDDQVTDAVDALESYDLIRAGLSRYFEEEFTDKEIGKLIRYAKLLIEDRDG